MDIIQVIPHDPPTHDALTEHRPRPGWASMRGSVPSAVERKAPSASRGEFGAKDALNDA